MKSIKPGRGPSMMSGVTGIFVALFGVFWTILAVGMGAWFMAPFGIIFVCIAVSQVIYNFKNAAGENRYSAYDIVDETEEMDPLNERFGEKKSSSLRSFESKGIDEESEFCPYCGVKVSREFEFCHKCGKRLP